MIQNWIYNGPQPLKRQFSYTVFGQLFTLALGDNQTAKKLGYTVRPKMTAEDFMKINELEVVE